jgi:hypothetical protein
MGKKYIIELEDGESVYKTITYNGYPMIQDVVPAPYAEPDLEQVRKEAYKDGYNAGFGKKIDASYQEGLNDAWEAARKICLNDSDGGLTVTEIANIFDVSYYRDAMKKYSAHEAIEKIRQYEQEKEEIKVGDEVINRDKKAVVTEITDRFVRIMYSDGSGYALFSENMTKTGRNFPEIAEVLAKMKETDNG